MRLQKHGPQPLNMLAQAGEQFAILKLKASGFTDICAQGTTSKNNLASNAKQLITAIDVNNKYKE